MSPLVGVGIQSSTWNMEGSLSCFEIGPHLPPGLSEGLFPKCRALRQVESTGTSSIISSSSHILQRICFREGICDKQGERVLRQSISLCHWHIRSRALTLWYSNLAHYKANISILRLGLFKWVNKLRLCILTTSSKSVFELSRKITKI